MIFYELQKLAKDAFGIAAHAIFEQFIYAKKPPHLEKLINQVRLGNGAYEQIVENLEKELELNGLEALGELQMNTVSQHAANTKADTPKLTCHHCRKPGPYRNQYRLLKDKKSRLKAHKQILAVKIVPLTTLSPSTITVLTTTITTTIKTGTELKEGQKLLSTK